MVPAGQVPTPRVPRVRISVRLFAQESIGLASDFEYLSVSVNKTTPSKSVCIVSNWDDSQIASEVDSRILNPSLLDCVGLILVSWREFSAQDWKSWNQENKPPWILALDAGTFHHSCEGKNLHDTLVLTLTTKRQSLWDLDGTGQMFASIYTVHNIYIYICMYIRLYMIVSDKTSIHVTNITSLMEWSRNM